MALKNKYERMLHKALVLWVKKIGIILRATDLSIVAFVLSLCSQGTRFMFIQQSKLNYIFNISD